MTISNTADIGRSNQISTKPRARDLGLPIEGVTGKYNAITDVAGVLVGYKTLSSLQQPELVTGALPVQTGVTAILPRGFEKKPSTVWGGLHVLNGNGELTGSHWLKDAGWFTGPILITNSHSVGMAHHGAVKWMINQYNQEWTSNHLWAMPIVAETYDGVLNDINGLHVTADHAIDAINSASSGAIAEGNVGGGAGMVCYEFKGGTGTSSRVLDIDGKQFTVAALVQANHGIRPWFTLGGKKVGEYFTEDRIPELSNERGSIICMIATDIPLNSSQLERLARRGALGIGRGGTPGGNNSGDIFMSFSTANQMALPQLSGTWRTLDFLNDERLDPIYNAVVGAVEESVLNAMLAATDVPIARPQGQICRAIDGYQLANLWKKMG